MFICFYELTFLFLILLLIMFIVSALYFLGFDSLIFRKPTTLTSVIMIATCFCDLMQVFF